MTKALRHRQPRIHERQTIKVFADPRDAETLKAAADAARVSLSSYLLTAGLMRIDRSAMAAATQGDPGLADKIKGLQATVDKLQQHMKRAAKILRS